MQQVKRTLRPTHYIIIFLFLGIASAIFYHFLHKPKTITINGTRIFIPAEKHASVLSRLLPPKTVTTTYTIHHGDSLASLFHRAKLPTTLWIRLVKNKQAAHYLTYLHEGQSINITKDAGGQFLYLIYNINLAKKLQVTLKKNGFKTELLEKPVTKTVLFKTVTIHKSLVAAEHATGLPLSLQYQLDRMLTSQGFKNDIHPGDHLDVLYHEYFVGDEKFHPGNIVAIEVGHKKDEHKLVRFTAPNKKTGYYLPNGKNTELGFLKFPVHFQRIASYFTYHRLDPITHKIQPHLGLDLDAPTGTPLKAIGNGIVILCQWVRGYGNTVMILYKDHYKTLYGHMEKYAKNLHVDEHVKKGQVVGYLGSTGWSTGPHVHFELYKNGTPINPLTAKMPRANPIPARYYHDFAYDEHRWTHDITLYEAGKIRT